MIKALFFEKERKEVENKSENMRGDKKLRTNAIMLSQDF